MAELITNLYGNNENTSLSQQTDTTALEIYVLLMGRYGRVTLSESVADLLWSVLLWSGYYIEITVCMHNQLLNTICL